MQNSLRNRLPWPIILIFVLYVAQVVTFALIYRQVHRQDPAAFLFNSAIVERQVNQDLAAIDRDLSFFKRELRAITVAATFPKLIRSKKATPAYRAPVIGRIVLNYEHEGIDMTIWFTPGALKEHGYLSITDSKRPQWRGFETEWKFNIPDAFFDDKGFPALVPEASANLVEAFEVPIREEKERLEKLVENLDKERSSISLQTPRWEFTEYLYFSVIVLGGGSGDIIPNSRLVRQLVIGQFILSIGLVVFLLSAVTQGRPSSKVTS